MANSPVNILGFETADLSEVGGISVSAGNTLAVSTAQANTQAPSVYSAHFILANAGAGKQTQCLIPTLSTSGTPNTNVNLTTPFLRLYVYLASVTNTSGNGSQLTPLVLFFNGSGQSAIQESGLFVNSSHKLVYQDVGGSYTTSTTVLALNSWYLVDLTLNASTGAWAARINDSVEISGTHSGAATVQFVQIGGGSTATFEYYVDDVWLESAAYSPDRGLVNFTATGNGHYTAWSGTASNAVPPNSTGAITSSTGGDTRTVTTNANISNTSTINPAKSLVYVKAGSIAQLTPWLRSGTTDQFLGTTTGLTSGVYQPQGMLATNDPNTTAA